VRPSCPPSEGLFDGVLSRGAVALVPTAAAEQISLTCAAYDGDGPAVLAEIGEREVAAGNLVVPLVRLSIGRDIFDRQDQAGWGSRLRDRLAADLREEFPDQRGWSRRNLHCMRSLGRGLAERRGVVP